MQHRLLIIGGSQRGCIIYLDADEITVGRHRSNSVAIPDLSMSRRHFSVLREAGGLHLRDLGSRNGTFINQERVGEHLLEEGDLIKAGGSLFVFLVHGKDEVAISSLGPVHLVDRGWALGGEDVAM